MTERRIDGFFYGLFMDSSILVKSQVEPAEPRRGYVEGYALRIGNRATLVPSPGSRAYGMIYALTHDELDKLYNAPGLEDYCPEAVMAITVESESYPALCYNLRETPAPDEGNPEYAASLRDVLGKLGFPSGYIESVG